MTCPRCPTSSTAPGSSSAAMAFSMAASASEKSRCGSAAAGFASAAAPGAAECCGARRVESARVAVPPVAAAVTPPAQRSAPASAPRSAAATRRNAQCSVKLSAISPCVITSRTCKGQHSSAPRVVFAEAMAAPRVFLLFLLLLAVYPAAIRPEDAPANKALSPAAQRWVEHTFSRLTTDEKIGQIVFPTYFGGFESTESADFKELMARVVANHIGGFILATRRGPRGIELSHVYETAVLTNQLQRAAAIPLLVGADFERGTVMRVEEGTAFPHAMAVGATGRPEDAYAM